MGWPEAEGKEEEKGESRRRRVGTARERNWGEINAVSLSQGCFMVTPVDKPHSTPIFVALDRVRHCPDELPPDQS